MPRARRRRRTELPNRARIVKRKRAPMSTAATLPETPSARQIIDARGVVTFFQPILSAKQKCVTGVEALSRGIIGVEALSRGTPTRSADLIQPAQLFGMAAREGCSMELERLCRETA